MRRALPEAMTKGPAACRAFGPPSLSLELRHTVPVPLGRLGGVTILSAMRGKVFPHRRSLYFSRPHISWSHSPPRAPGAGTVPLSPLLDRCRFGSLTVARTWTLADPEVWARTDRLYDWLSVICGSGLVGVAVAGMPAPVAGGAVLAATAVLVLMTVILSYLISRGRPGTSH